MSLELHTTDTRVTRANDIAGRELTVPGANGEFAKVLGPRPVNMAQKNANDRATGWRVLENALSKQFAGVSTSQLRRYDAYRSLQKTVDGMKAAKDDPYSDAVLQATREQFEANVESNMKYLELQHKMQQMNTQFSCLSNLMKARHDSVKNSVSEIK